MSTPIITARRNLLQRIANLLRKADNSELNLTPWQLSEVQEAIEQLEQERFAQGEGTMSEAERPDLYETGYVANEPVERRHWSTNQPPYLQPHSDRQGRKSARHAMSCTQRSRAIWCRADPSTWTRYGLSL
jgi:hypothetical protein